MKPELVELAQREASTIFEDDPELTLPEHRLLQERIEQLHQRPQRRELTALLASTHLATGRAIDS